MIDEPHGEIWTFVPVETDYYTERQKQQGPSAGIACFCLVCLALAGLVCFVNYVSDRVANPPAIERAR